MPVNPSDDPNVSNSVAITELDSFKLLANQKWQTVKQWMTIGKINTNLYKTLANNPINNFITHLVDTLVQKPA